MANVTVKSLDNGPYLVEGEVEITDGKGQVIEVKKQCHLCRCGLSSKMPYCSGAHVGKFNDKVGKA